MSSTAVAKKTSTTKNVAIASRIIGGEAREVADERRGAEGAARQVSSGRMDLRGKAARMAPTSCASQ